MLVLTRKQGEGIWIGDNVKVTLVESRGGRVRLGIEAPREVAIARDELVERQRIVKDEQLNQKEVIDEHDTEQRHPVGMHRAGVSR